MQSIWFDARERRIHVAGADGKTFHTSYSGEPGRTDYHSSSYRQYNRLLRAAGKPHDEQAAAGQP